MVIISKTFTTAETMLNAKTVKVSVPVGNGAFRNVQKNPPMTDDLGGSSHVSIVVSNHGKYISPLRIHGRFEGVLQMGGDPY